MGNAKTAGVTIVLISYQWLSAEQATLILNVKAEQTPNSESCAYRVQHTELGTDNSDRYSPRAIILVDEGSWLNEGLAS